MNLSPHVFVIMGATGDLTQRKLIPALYRIMSEGGADDRTHLLGVGPSDLSDEQFRDMAAESLDEAGYGSDAAASFCDRIFYQKVDRGTSDLVPVAERIAVIESEYDLPGNRVFYLALPPAVFGPTIERLGEAGLNRSQGWTRLVIEKPFGTSLASAQALNRLVHRHFDESQVYRIDHYLGKETVQNLLTFRFANPIFENSWNRDRLEAIEITVAESLGVEERAGYYESAGVVRDMVQNHLTQLLIGVAMEAPSGTGADAIRDQKIHVLDAVKPIEPGNVVFARYKAGSIDGEPVPGYLDEPGVAPDSITPTFVGLRMYIDSWRWEGVPFYLRTGKRLPRRTTQIAATFKRAPICIVHGRSDDCPIAPNVVVLTLQPDEGFEVRFEVKTPGSDGVVSKALAFDYEAEFDVIPPAYQTLLTDVIEGDQTLFVRADEVEASWRLWDPVIAYENEIHPYRAGTWGPAVLNESLRLWTEEWTMRSRDPR
jgi:glucose-6-phosphate 1-dehydrogenase